MTLWDVANYKTVSCGCQLSSDVKMRASEPLAGGSRFDTVTRLVKAHFLGAEMYKKTLIVNPDGRRVAYIARESTGRELVCVDGRWEKTYDRIYDVVFSPDSHHTAYLSRVGDRPMMVIDAEENRQYAPAIDHIPIFSPNSERFAYVSRGRDSNRFLVVDSAAQDTHYNNNIEKSCSVPTASVLPM